MLWLNATFGKRALNRGPTRTYCVRFDYSNVRFAFTKKMKSVDMLCLAFYSWKYFICSESTPFWNSISVCIFCTFGRIGNCVQVVYISLSGAKSASANAGQVSEYIGPNNWKKYPLNSFIDTLNFKPDIFVLLFMHCRHVIPYWYVCMTSSDWVWKTKYMYLL